MYDTWTWSGPAGDLARHVERRGRATRRLAPVPRRDSATRPRQVRSVRGRRRGQHDDCQSASISGAPGRGRVDKHKATTNSGITSWQPSWGYCSSDPLSPNLAADGPRSSTARRPVGRRCAHLVSDLVI
ncbi:unnamed protein product [Parajaminaea phylloscopi]